MDTSFASSYIRYRLGAVSASRELDAAFALLVAGFVMPRVAIALVTVCSA